ncbi:MAG: type II toxin-antitoxin system RelE/ParE family toxin [Ruminococcus flavefaciens]|nr:type II toxin-antitoxin system RelE/ParE family toxin [Ruminococcus flavefaciens]
MIIHNYESKSGRDLIMEYINSLEKKEQIDALSVLKCLENGEINRLQTKRWQNKIYEVYFYKHNRIFYVVNKGTDIYILHACRKQKNKTARKDKDIIIRRAKELGKNLNITLI